MTLIRDHEDADHAVVFKDFTVVHRLRTDAIKVQTIDIFRSGRNLSTATDGVILKHDLVAVIANEDVIVGHTKLLGDFSMQFQHAVFAMDRHEVFGVH